MAETLYKDTTYTVSLLAPGSGRLHLRVSMSKDAEDNAYQEKAEVIPIDLLYWSPLHTWPKMHDAVAECVYCTTRSNLKIAQRFNTKARADVNQILL